jgi:dihydroorotate dehydrogenase electron transfer subunit
MKKYMHDFRVKRNSRLSNHYFVLELENPEGIPDILPGQFAQVLVENSPQTYLRRPISIYDFDQEKRTLSLLIKICGSGTAKLSLLQEGAPLNLIYPLGNSFNCGKETKALLVGGGVGIAPMLLLAKKLHASGSGINILIGGKTSLDILEHEHYQSFGRVLITTEDGSMGEKGFVTNHPVFTEELATFSRIYACGPDPMMKAVAAEAQRQAVPCEVSLENLMACGIGACLCCIVETVNGNKTTCVEGPVYDTRTLADWTTG